MDEEIIYAFYSMWCQTPEYHEQSAMENEKYDEYQEEIIKILGQEVFCDIETTVIDQMYETEVAENKQDYQGDWKRAAVFY